MATVDDDGLSIDFAYIGSPSVTDFGRGLEVMLDGYLVTGFSKELGERGGTCLMRPASDFAVDRHRGLEHLAGSRSIELDADGTMTLAGPSTFMIRSGGRRSCRCRSVPRTSRPACATATRSRRRVRAGTGRCRIRPDRRPPIVRNPVVGSPPGRYRVRPILSRSSARSPGGVRGRGPPRGDRGRPRPWTGSTQGSSYRSTQSRSAS